MSKKKKKGKITTDENDEKISVGLDIWWKYFSKYYGFSFFMAIQFSFVVLIGSRVASDYLVGTWAYQEDQQSKFWYYCSLSMTFASTAGLGVFLRAIFCQLFTLRSTRKLHK